MPRLEKNSVMPDFEYVTPFAQGKLLSETVKQVKGKTALVFLRYYGCPICQLDLTLYAEAYDAITASGGQMLVVLQSDPAGLAAQISPETFPYEIICDPEMKLYQMLEINPAASMLKMMSLKAVKKVIQSSKMGYKHGAYEGNEQQLPAAFILDADLNVCYSHYGKDAGDVPDAQELAKLMK